MIKSPISVLQELAARQRIQEPVWDISGSGQDHLKNFECSCEFNSQTVTGTGATKKEAKLNAAINMLKVFDVKMDNTEELPSICLIPSSKTKTAITVNYVGRLNEFCAANRYPHAIYTEEPIILNNQFCLVCKFQEFTTTGFGSTKKEAKQDAAKNMLQLIKEKDIGASCIVDSPRDVEQSIDENKKALKVYADMMENLSIADSVSTTVGNNVGDTSAADSELLKITNWAELEVYIHRKGWKHRVRIFQRQPLMLVLKLNACTLIDEGETQEEICEKFATEVIWMSKTGFDFSKPLFPLLCD